MDIIDKTVHRREVYMMLSEEEMLELCLRGEWMIEGNGGTDKLPCRYIVALSPNAAALMKHWYTRFHET